MKLPGLFVKKDQTELESQDLLLLHDVYEYLAEKSTPENLEQHLVEARKNNPQFLTLHYAKLYLHAEALLDPTELRTTVLSRYSPDQLSKPLAVIFGNENQKKLFILESFLYELIRSPLISISLEEVKQLLSRSNNSISSMITLQDNFRRETLPQIYDDSAHNDIRETLDLVTNVISQKITEHDYVIVIDNYKNFLRDYYSSELDTEMSALFPENPEVTNRSDTHETAEKMLDQEIKRRKEIEQRTLELEEKVKEFQHQNKELEDTKLAMINLLEDARELEKEITIERDRARGIIQSMNEGVILVDKESKIITVNPIALNVLETNEEECMGQPIVNVLTLHQDKQVVAEADHPGIKTIQSGNPISTNLEDNLFIHLQSGKNIPVSINTSPIKQEEISGAVIVFRDVSFEKEKRGQIEQLVKQRTQQLKEEQAKLTASINSLLRGYIITDTTGKVLLVNKSINTIFENITGAVQDISVIQQYLEGSFDLISKFNDAVGQAAKHETTSSTYEFTYGTKYLKIFIHPIYLSEEDPSIIGVVILIEDITDERALQKSREEFFSIASHELRTPLTAIRGNTSLILSHFDKLKTDDLKKMLGSIYDSSLRLINIVNEFLNSSRLEQGRMVFDVKPFDLKPIVQEVASEVKNMIEEKKLAFKTEGLDREVPRLLGDRDKVKEVLFNLIGNAIKFTEKGEIKVKVSVDGTFVFVYVSDTGKGIPPENFSLLFRKFQQASNNVLTRDNSQGTGLGLYISKLMMQGMNGDISIQASVMNKGSTFQIKIPISL